METETINPSFMKTLIRCYLLQKQAKKKVFHDGCFLKQVLKVFKWQSKIKRQIKLKNIESPKESPPQASSSSIIQDPVSVETQKSPSNVSQTSSGKEVSSSNQQSTLRSSQKPKFFTLMLKSKTVGDLDTVRRNLWHIIVRKDIVQAHRRKVNFREQKLLKSRAIAYRCQSHFQEFHKQNNKHKLL